jgi:outer membrane protein assembly factor BamE (lipoprotein component of BamABCDE complex)
MKTLQVLVPALILAVSGCATTDTLATRLEKNKDYVSQLTPEQQERLHRFSPAVGDKKKDVLIALGEPTFVTRKGETEEYVYPSGREVKILSNLENNEPVHARPSRREAVTSDLVLVFKDECVVEIKGRARKATAGVYLERDTVTVPPAREPKWEPQTQAQMGTR